jgi:hypothetical protein
LPIWTAPAYPMHYQVIAVPVVPEIPDHFAQIGASPSKK